jgi:hypothetical protein
VTQFGSVQIGTPRGVNPVKSSAAEFVSLPNPRVGKALQVAEKWFFHGVGARRLSDDLSLRAKYLFASALA